jgi:hypothetical protein
MRAMLLLCEPQCSGLSHVPVNAAILATARVAWPDEELLFLAETCHLDAVRAHLDRRDHRLSGVEYQSFGGQARAEEPRLTVVRRHLLVLSVGSRRGARRIIFCSASPIGQIAMRYIPAVPRTIVRHGELAQLGSKNRLRRTLAAWLLRESPQGTRHIVLGKTIASNVQKIVPTAAVFPLPHPYLFAGFRPHTLNSPRRFGFVGLGYRYKGHGSFLEISEALTRASVPAAFLEVGPRRTASTTEDGPLRPLAADEYERALNALDYAVYPQDPEHYRFVASGALMDALSAGVPPIAIRTANTEDVFGALGGAGHLCINQGEMAGTIRKLALASEPREYARQRDQIVQLREAFRPSRLSHLFADIVEQPSG